ncbi:RNA helicase [Sarracenia purpurea var. burkii]
MKAGAEDLWNKADGPIRSTPPQSPPAPINRSIRTSIDLRKLISESDRTLDSENLKDSQKPRYYSVYTRSRTGSSYNFRRNESSTSESDSESEDDLLRRRISGNGSQLRFGSRGEESSGDDFSDAAEKEMKGRGNVRKLMSSAALGKYDIKKTRRVPLKFLEQEENLSDHIEAIRNEVNKRNLMENAVEKSDEDSILSQKRYMNCFIH